MIYRRKVPHFQALISSCPISGSNNIAAKNMESVSFPNFALLASMNVLPPFSCLFVPYHIVQCDLYFFVYTLFSFYFITWYFCINSYKKAREFSPAPTTNFSTTGLRSKRQNSFIVSGSETTYTFRVNFSRFAFNRLAIDRKLDCRAFKRYIDCNMTAMMYDLHFRFLFEL